MGNHLEEERQEAHELLDLLPAEKLNAVRGLLAVMVEAATENEEITPETAAAIGRARTSLAQGRGTTHEGVRREFGLSK